MEGREAGKTESTDEYREFRGKWSTEEYDEFNASQKSNSRINEDEWT